MKKKPKLAGAANLDLLTALWNSSANSIPGGGEFTDTAIGPNKILRKGTWDIEGDDQFAGVRYASVITLEGLVRHKKPARATA